MARVIIRVLIIGFFATIAGAMFLSSAYWVKYEKPDPQPIAFPHDVHAGDQNIACVTCHTYVDKSKHATVPAMSVCMSCHASIQSDSPEIARLKEYWNEQEPIPWQRIHSLPKHVYFSHKRHIKADIECATCHGDMTVVKTVKQVRTLEMGFCVSCHNAKGAPKDCWTCHK